MGKEEVSEGEFGESEGERERGRTCSASVCISRGAEKDSTEAEKV